MGGRRGEGVSVGRSEEKEIEPTPFLGVQYNVDCQLCMLSGKWAAGRKKNITLTRRKKTLPDADRQVSEQPLMFSKSVFNLRKLSEMPFHFIHSGQSALLYNEVLFNFDWIQGKIRGQSLNHVLEDFALALEMEPELDVR